ncbi:hypothetical protein L7F22_017116 [Adiantum nelumboides]|nr:hypothetical protein [Adiantum nelumboides]
MSLIGNLSTDAMEPWCYIFLYEIKEIQIDEEGKEAEEENDDEEEEEDGDFQLCASSSTTERKSELWDEIAESMQKGPFCRDAQQCRDKWEKLMAGYKKACEALAATYEPKDLANVLRLKRELVNLKMKGSNKIKDHVQKLRAIVAELMAIGEPVPKRELAFMLLNNLPTWYAHLVVTIDGREEARDLEYVIRRVEQEEQRLELDRKDARNNTLDTRRMDGKTSRRK